MPTYVKKPKMKRVCVVCESTYLTHSHTSSTCSPDCYKVYRRIVYDFERSSEVRTCANCGEVINSKRRKKYCSLKCRNEALHLKRPPIINCVVCNKEFKPGGPQKTCSSECSKELRKRNKRRIDRRKYKENPHYKFHNSIKLLVWKSIKDGRDRERFNRIFGYNIYALIRHLENQFQSGMSWDNYGSYWHIDHIKPVSSFGYVSEKEPSFRECWKLDNLQPLTATQNIIKSNKT